MKFEFTACPDFDFLKNFAEQFEIPQSGNILIIPEELGQGSVRKIDFAADFKLLFHRYTFNEQFILKRIAPEEKNDIVSITFYAMALPNNFLSNEKRTFACRRLDNSAIEIASSDLNSEIRFPADTEILFTVIGIRKSTLSDLLDLERSYPLIENITRDHSSFLYHE